MTRAPTDRSHLSIGEVLSLLQDEFPDVTISKIRFLESQGLLDPERTPSGYRKFYETDIERLRWILRQQKDHYLPLKVIKDRLDDIGPDAGEPEPPATGGRRAASGTGDAADGGRRDGRLDNYSSAGAQGGDVQSGARRGDGRAPADRGSGARVGMAPPTLPIDDRLVASSESPSPAGDRGRRGGRGSGSDDRGWPGGARRGASSDDGWSGDLDDGPAGGGGDRRRGGDWSGGPDDGPASGAGDQLPGSRPSRGRAVNGPGSDLPPRPAPDAPARPTNGTPPAALHPPASGPAAPTQGPAGPSAGDTGFDPPASSVSLTLDELAEASGMGVRDLRDLERFGLLEGHQVGDDTYYDGDALVVARTASGFLQHGIEARHLRTYKVSVDREAGLFEQIVLPLLKQRNPEAHRRASRTVSELVHLGEVMRGVLLRRELRNHLGP